MRSRPRPPSASVPRDLTEASRFPNQRDFDSTCWLGGGQQEMAKPYSQDLRDRVIDAVERGKMSRRAAARRYEISESVAIKWLERVGRNGSREPVGHGGHRASKLMPHRAFLEAARAEKSDVTLQALCDRLSAERGVKADTSMMSRFFRRIGVGVGPRAGQGSDTDLTVEPGFRKMEAHGQAPHVQHRVQAPGRSGVSRRRDASRSCQASRHQP